MRVSEFQVWHVCFCSPGVEGERVGVLASFDYAIKIQVLGPMVQGVGVYLID
jgi:hypothetical protein